MDTTIPSDAQYWVVSPNIHGGGELSEWKAAVRTTHCAFMGWGSKDNGGRKFAEIKPGDFVLVAGKSNPNKELVGVGLASGNVMNFRQVKPKKMPNGLTCELWVHLNPFVSLKDKPSDYGLDFNQATYLGSPRPRAIYQLRPTTNMSDQKIVSRLMEEIREQMSNDWRQEMVNILKDFGQLILSGPPGTGKTRQALALAAEIMGCKNDEFQNLRGSRWNIVQFHPAYNYEDFVRGIRVSTDGSNVTYKTRNGILGEMAENAFNDRDNSYVLIVDEINRANLAGVLGELIYALEYRNQPVDTPYELDEGRSITIPKNLLIVGTMNTADRSIGHIDYAIRRRFAFLECLPDRSVVEAYYQDTTLRQTALTLFDAVASLFVQDGTTAPALGPDFTAKDVQLGHSYFLAESLEALQRKLKYQVKPILNEYLRDGVLIAIAQDTINNLSC